MRVSIDIPEEHLLQALCCGFNGGIRYWCLRAVVATPMHHARTRDRADQLLAGGDLALTTCEGAQHTMDFVSIERALHWLADPANKHTHHLVDLFTGRVDATTGDVLVQAAIFGDVVYG